MAERGRRNFRSTVSTLEPDEIDSCRPMGLDPMQGYHLGPGGKIPNPGSSKRGVTQVDGAAPTALHHRAQFDTGPADGIIHEDRQFAGFRLPAGDSLHGVRSYDEMGSKGTFAVYEDRAGRERTSWNESEWPSFQPIPAPAMSCRTQESVTAQENSSSFNPSSFTTHNYLQRADLYRPPCTQASTVGQDFILPHFVMDHTLSSSSSSSSSSYLSASSLPPGSIGGVFVPGAPMDSEQVESVGVDHMAAGFASVQLDDVEMDDTETAANQETENYAITAKAIQLANRLFQPNLEGDTILHLMIIKGVSESMILKIIELFGKRDLLNQPNNRRQTPLHLATTTRRDDIIARLLQNGARRQVFDRDLDTPLHIACRQGDVARVRTLHPAAVDPELEQELRSVAESSNKEGQSCLHVAAISNHLNVVQYLVEDCKVNINLKELRRGRTILHLAVEKKNLDLVRYLVNLPDSYELLVEDLTYDYYSALQMAQMTNQTQIVDLLLLAGAQQIMGIDTR